MGSEPLAHVLLVSFPGQGHVNPLLRLGKRLASKGLHVTFTASENVGKQMRKGGGIGEGLTPVGDGFIRFEFFEDGLNEDEPRRQDLDWYLPLLEKAGWEVIINWINNMKNNFLNYLTNRLECSIDYFHLLYTILIVSVKEVVTICSNDHFTLIFQFSQFYQLFFSIEKLGDGDLSSST